MDDSPGNAGDPLTDPGPPDHLLIQTVTGCNGRCRFCPNSKTRRSIPTGRRMAGELFRTVIDQCLELGVRRFSVYLMNEPMLDPELPQRIAYIAARIRKPQYVKVISNGSLLTERMARGLLDSGLDKLKLSVQSLDPHTYREVTGLPLARTLRNIARLMELKAAAGAKRPRLEVAMVDSELARAELPAAHRFWQAQGVRLSVQPMENRAGHAAIRQSATGNLERFTGCRRLSEQLGVLQDGRVVQCCADWEQQGVMGDLTRQRISDVWRAPRYGEFRRRLAAWDVAGMICAGCRIAAAATEHDDPEQQPQPGPLFASPSPAGEETA
ncbi:MAG: radical SAM protein [Desulfobacterales bacterium]|jgi:pyruvate-formate lyase-activating enzyme|nr:radical SAM protein [Desulfobacterales bacterium]